MIDRQTDRYIDRLIDITAHSSSAMLCLYINYTITTPQTENKTLRLCGDIFVNAVVLQ